MRNGPGQLPVATERVDSDQGNVRGRRIRLESCRQIFDVAGDAIAVGIKQSAKFHPARIILQVLI